MKKVTYISIANAIAITAVMIGHLKVTGMSGDPNTPIANMIERFGAFQMPLFMCISGFLFAMTSGYRKTYGKLIQSKVKRLLVPFLALSLFTFAFKLCLPSSMLEHGVGFTPEYIFKIFFVPFRGPVPHLWFVISLFTIFLLTPLLKKTVKSNLNISLTFIVLAMATFTPPILSKYDIEYLAVDKTLSMLIWFYLGMVMCLKGVSEELDSWRVMIVCGLLYTLLLYAFEIPVIGNLVRALLGILFIYSLSHKLSELCPNLFSSWRNYTYQIYLLHMYPVMAWKYIYKRHLIADEDIWFTLVWICSLICAIALPTIIAKIAERMPAKIKVMIGL